LRINAKTELLFSSVSQYVLSNERVKHMIRLVVFAYAVLIVCPIRYWPIAEGLDNTWVFALNYAAAHGLIAGRDVVFTMGPLGYLTFPENIGNNLARGLIFQSFLWALLIFILVDLFFRSGFPLRNLVFFTILLGLSSPLFWFNRNGPESVLLAGVLILLVHFRLRGELWRYIAALGMLGLLPFLKLTSGLIAAGALAGFLPDRIWNHRWKAWREFLLAIFVPGAVAVVCFWLLLGSAGAVVDYIVSSIEIAGGYSVAMSMEDSSFAMTVLGIVAAALVVILLAAVIEMLATRDRRLAVFYSLFLAIPLFVSFKHGFVRQDIHVVVFFCFGSLALGITILAMPLNSRRSSVRLGVILSIFVTVWVGFVFMEADQPVATVTGLRTWNMLTPAFKFGDLQHTLDAAAYEFTSSARMEPQVKNIVKDEPVASLDTSYSNAIVDGLNLQLYPVIQRYSAYTPYLDKLNADWIRNKGPKFLTFDAEEIDGRHSWTETPAMWIEIYRWYNTRLLGDHTLLLERREGPRFTRLESQSDSQMSFQSEVQIPQTQEPVFWSLQCPMSIEGKIRKLLFRVPRVNMIVKRGEATDEIFRVIPDVLGQPSMGNYLPNSLSEFAQVFDAGKVPSFSVASISFGGPGISSYARNCNLQLLRAVH
jgi:hypothetical protein